MDILNFISWIASKRRVVTSTPDDALVPIGIRTETRDDKYTTVAIKKSDLVPSSFKYEIGQYVPSEGGVIAHRWLSTTELGSPETGSFQNYLVVDTNDLSSSAPWATGSFDISNVESIWNGATNTANLIAAGPSEGIDTGTAAELCNSSTNNGKSDWYLPAIDELSKIWQNRWEISQGIISAVGTQLAFNSTSDYWSSTEYSTTGAWSFRFQFGVSNLGSGKSSYIYVRAVRKFSLPI